MVNQVVIIGGGMAFDSYQDFINYLQTKQVDKERLKPSPDWKDTIGVHLHKITELLVPSMPNRANARYDEWSLWLSRVNEVLEDNVVLIGHSLGGIFLAKYLSNERFPKKIRATILVAAPFDTDGSDESLGDFEHTDQLELFAEQGGDIVLMHSSDDPVVPFEQLKKYQNRLPDAEAITFDDRQHFNQESFPELVTIINQL